MDLEVAGKAAQSHTHYIYSNKFRLFLPLEQGKKSEFRFIKGMLDGHINTKWRLYSCTPATKNKDELLRWLYEMYTHVRTLHLINDVQQFNNFVLNSLERSNSIQPYTTFSMIGAKGERSPLTRRIC
jgi:hypothetical protein